DPAAAELANDPVGDGLALHLNLLLAAEGFLGVLGCFLHGRGHFVSLAVAPGHRAAAVAHDHQRVEAKPPATLDHRGTAANLALSFSQPVLTRLAIFGHPSLLRSRIAARPCGRRRPGP